MDGVNKKSRKKNIILWFIKLHKGVPWDIYCTMLGYMFCLAESIREHKSSSFSLEVLTLQQGRFEQAGISVSKQSITVLFFHFKPRVIQVIMILIRVLW